MTDADDGRHETREEQLDRNWGDLLQELRVIQTGVQLLTGFLLTLPFQQRFTRLSDGERAVYLATAATSILATILLQAPVVIHRAVFRRHQRAAAVAFAHRLVLVGLTFLGLAVIGVSCLLTAAVVGLAYGGGVAAAVLVLLAMFWAVLPVHARRAHVDADEATAPSEERLR